MPDREELEQYLDDALVGYLQNEAETHGWTEDEYARMLKMEASKSRGDEHVDA